MVVDVSRRSTSFEHRLVKYYSRGFAIVFPSLKVSEDIAEEGNEGGREIEWQMGRLTFFRNTGAQDEARTYTMYVRYQHDIDRDARHDYDSDAHPCVLGYANIIKA